MKKNSFRYLLIILITSFLIFYGKKYTRLTLNKITYISNLIQLNIKNSYFKNCKIGFIDNIPKNSILIVGHAYGSSSQNKKQFFSSKLINLLEIHRSDIQFLFLTGDVFEHSTLVKWEELFQRYKNNFQILIAPGNHDIGFKLINYKNKLIDPKYLNYPFSLNINDFKFIFEDSFTENWLINQEVFNKINQTKYNKKNIILRHNIPIKEFLDLANSTQGLSTQLPSFKELSMKLNKNVIFIAGDTGASVYAPSFYCKRYRNITIIANGIGNFRKDIILVFSNGSLFKYKI